MFIHENEILPVHFTRYVWIVTEDSQVMWLTTKANNGVNGIFLIRVVPAFT